MVKERNEKAIKVSWQFTAEDARQKLKRHYEKVISNRQVRSIGGDELSIIFVTHILSFAIEFADYIAFLDQGRFVELLPADVFISESKHPVARKFIENSFAVLKL